MTHKSLLIFPYTQKSNFTKSSIWRKNQKIRKKSFLTKQFRILLVEASLKLPRKNKSYTFKRLDRPQALCLCLKKADGQTLKPFKVLQKSTEMYFLAKNQETS